MAIEHSRVELPGIGRPVGLYTLRQASGFKAEILTLGGVVTSLWVPDRDGRLEDVVLGFAEPKAYLDNRPFFGALIGRYGNRIARGRFTLDGIEHTLPTNDGPNHLHGGPAGFHAVPWGVLATNDGPEPSIRLAYSSADGEEGYPGRLDVEVVYTLTSEGALRIDYQARTDHPTVVNLTQHSYFNLAGHNAGSVHDHELRLDASRFLPVDETSIPTGELKPVEGTPFDFRSPVTLWARIEADDEQLRRTRGYDHTFVIDGWNKGLREIAEVRERAWGRRMIVRTTEPGVQLYSGNYLDGIRGKGGASYGRRAGFCLEAQHFPDSPNQPAFPSTRLSPSEVYRQTTEYVFAADPLGR
jgi:aldose 1-epimerase